MAYLQFQVESPSGTIRRTGRVSGNSLSVSYAGSSYSVGAGTTTKSCGGKLMKGTLLFGSSAIINCSNMIMPNDIVIRANSTTYENYQIFATSGTFTVPYGVTSINVCCVGGGGGGAGIDRDYRLGAGGGGGGYVTQGTFTVVPATQYTVTVGKGGSYGPCIYSYEVPSGRTMSDYCKGGNGTASSFGSLLTANGGNGSPFGSRVAGNGGCGGGAGGTNAYMFYADRSIWEADYQGGADGGSYNKNSKCGYYSFRSVNGSWDGNYYSADIVHEGQAGTGLSASTTFRGSNYGGGGGGGAYAYTNSSYSPCYVWGGNGGTRGGGRGAGADDPGYNGTANTGGGGGGAAGEGSVWNTLHGGNGGSGVVIIYW